MCRGVVDTLSQTTRAPQTESAAGGQHVQRRRHRTQLDRATRRVGTGRRQRSWLRWSGQSQSAGPGRQSRHPARIFRKCILLPLAAAVLAAAGFLSLTGGGSNVRAAQPLLERLDTLVAANGFSVRQIALTGHIEGRDRAVFDALATDSAQSLLAFDLAAARTRIEKLPWVQTATVTRAWPDGLRIIVRQREPFAVWSDRQTRSVIGRDGHVIRTLAPGEITDLPQLSGAEANTATDEIAEIATRHPRILDAIATFERVTGRRWRLHLVRGARVDLPAFAPLRALEQFIEHPSWDMARAGSVARIDLRRPDWMILRQPVRSNATDNRKATATSFSRG